MRRPLPVEIVGGGLSGLALGLALRRKGVPVTVFEAHDYPRHRVCGEFIAGLDETTATSLGMEEFLADAHPHKSVTYHVRDRPLRPFLLPVAALGISRHTLDARLARAFAAAGGDLRTHTKASETEAPAGRVFAVGRRRKGPHWVGLKVHVRNLALVNDFEVHLGERCYVGLSRLEDGAVNVCGIFAPQEHAGHGVDLLLSYLEHAGLAVLAARIRSAEIDPASSCVTAAPLGNWRVLRSPEVRLGDACATIPPFTGNGLAMALQGAALAVGPLLAYSAGDSPWNETADAIAAAQRTRFRRRLALAALIHPFFLERRRQALLAAVVGHQLIPFGAFYAALR
jgi:2-polyprenyl-6-methoxyphenol hydroxylase-like FAD-dependent oxidoreductase